MFYVKQTSKIYTVIEIGKQSAVCKDNKGECKDGKECKDTECCDEKECKFLRREFSYTKFEQTLVLPDDVDKAHIKAKVKHGVLHIKLPRKANEEKPQTQQNIAIE